ncbi:hypothetical protein OG948_58865 (plasmid) [Embleya sp. NBC_00888]|uniref:hypothetical protein n=1 Tax=Embleya sp. NBC_00888 TaxID=2975960 RepID=UPI002F914D9F|nr:hypothetical protein OG948_58865 [Embleya sp. NBC_00888]
MDIKAPTADQKQRLRDDHVAHRTWLREKEINEQPYDMKEIPYTGLILAGLLDPESAPSVCHALLAGHDPSLRTDDVRVLWPYCPSSGVGLVFEVHRPDRRELVVVEHKRFRSPSHAPGYRTNPGAPWQTDVAHEAATSDYWPQWMHETDPELPVRFVVLDGYGKPMDQMFPSGLRNEHWAVTGYSQFAAILRAEHDRGVRGLIPLLSTLFAGRES